MTTMEDQAVYVKAKYSFKGKNNDELTFSKGDTITLTQKLDGGWWEGTLNGKTGWFPSNYVVDTKPTEKPTDKSRNQVNGNHSKPVNCAASSSSGAVNRDHNNRNVYRKMILRNMLESEREHVRELNHLLDSYLKPLGSDSLLSEEHYRSLMGNLEQVLQFQSSFLKTLEEQSKKPTKEQRIGGEFMRSAPTLKTLLKIYCENHPLAIETLNKSRDQLVAFMQKRGSDLMTLVTGLSRPFRHLEKYPNMLQELERNTEESHPDRGDTQRTIAVYRDLTKLCSDTRKQKEMQLELLSGMVSGWEGEPIASLGEIIHMGTVQVANEDGEKEDCCLVLLTDVLLVLQISFEMNTYIFKRKIQLDGACVRKLPELVLSNGVVYSHVLELQPKSGQRNAKSVVMVHGSSEELNRWLELFQSAEHVVLDDDSCFTISPTTPLQYSTVQNVASPLMKPQVSTLPAPGHAEFLKNKAAIENNAVVSGRADARSSSHCFSSSNGTPERSIRTFFRPLPAQRLNSAASSSSGKTNVKMRKKEFTGQVLDEEETELLKIVESYCISEKTRPPLRRNVDSPQLIVAEDEKIFVEEVVGSEIIMQERTLVDTVYTLKDQVSHLREEVARLTKMVESEQKSRRRIEELVRKHIVTQRNSASSTALSKSQPSENGCSSNESPTQLDDGPARNRNS